MPNTLPMDSTNTKVISNSDKEQGQRAPARWHGVCRNVTVCRSGARALSQSGDARLSLALLFPRKGSLKVVREGDEATTNTDAKTEVHPSFSSDSVTYKMNIM